MTLVTLATWPRPVAQPAEPLPSPLIGAPATIADEAGAGGPLLLRSGAPPLTIDRSTPSDGHVTAGETAGVQVTSATSLYDIEGADFGALLASMQQRGPRDGDGQWAASTGWVFRWSYQPAARAGCRVRRASVSLDLTYTYPHWTPPPGAARSLVSAWQRYLDRVKLHEHGHRDIAQDTADDLVRTLEALPAQPTCDDLATTARAAVSALLARHAEAQVAYDRETGHGASQGAVLSPAPDFRPEQDSLRTRQPS